MQTPAWLKPIGVSAWYIVGITLVGVGLILVAALTEIIVLPVITATVIAAVGSPLVSAMNRHHIPRGVGAALLLFLLVLIGFAVTYVVIRSVASEAASVSNQLSAATDQIESWLKSLGVDPKSAHDAGNAGKTQVSDAVSALLGGLAKGITELSSLAFFGAMTTLSLFFLLKDGPVFRDWTERHMGIPREVAHARMQRVLESFRGYFLGVTIVAAFSAMVVGIGSFILGTPLIGTIVVITFLGGFVPYLGAWTAGAFAVLLTLGGAGVDAAIAMSILQLAANSVLQQLVQPFAMGAALGIHPLVVLVVTIAGGCLFGAAGLILAAPLTAAIVKMTADSSAEATTG